MSISTKTGDTGMTSLLYGRRVSKSDSRIVAAGDLEELNAVLGIIRASLGGNQGNLAEFLRTIQRELVDLTPGVLADTQDRDRYQESNYAKIGPASLIRLEDKITELEERSGNGQRREHSLPGDSVISAHLHLARAICRRSERSILAVRELGFVVPPLTLRYLNRLADLLLLLTESA